MAQLEDHESRVTVPARTCERYGWEIGLTAADDFRSDRFAIDYVWDFLMVLARAVLCADCGGTGCGQCKRRGWQHVAGRELGKLTLRETHKLVAPADALSLALYEVPP